MRAASGVLATVSVDEHAAPADRKDAGVWWKDLGDFTISGGVLNVALTDGASGPVLADGVRVERTGN